MRRPSWVPARYISLGEVAHLGGDARRRASARARTPASWSRLPVPSPARTRSSRRPARSASVMATQCSPLAWNAVTRDQRRDTQIVAPEVVEALVLGSREARFGLGHHRDDDVVRREHRREHADRPRRGRDVDRGRCRGRPEPQTRAERPHQPAVGRPRRIRRLARLGEAELVATGLDDHVVGSPSIHDERDPGPGSPTRRLGSHRHRPPGEGTSRAGRPRRRRPGSVLRRRPGCRRRAGPPAAGVSARPVSASHATGREAWLRSTPANAPTTLAVSVAAMSTAFRRMLPPQ